MSNFHQLEVVGRSSETQIQVSENYSYLFDFTQRNYNVDVETHNLCSITMIYSADKVN